MKYLNLSAIPAEVIEKAISLIKAQGETPYSPGEKRRNGRVALCAAAAIACAGLTLASSEGRVKEFEAEIVNTRSTDPIRKVFIELGWPVEACDNAIVANNSFPDDERSESIISQFEKSLLT